MYGLKLWCMLWIDQGSSSHCPMCPTVLIWYKMSNVNQQKSQPIKIKLVAVETRMFLLENPDKFFVLQARFL